MPGGNITKYLILGLGIWTLYYAWRGIVPSGHEVGKRMRARTRFIFLLGGALLTGLGIALWREH
jgi:hypothetical protein